MVDGRGVPRKSSPGSHRMVNRHRFGATATCIQGGKNSVAIDPDPNTVRLRETRRGSAPPRAISAPRPNSKESSSASSSKPSSDTRATMACRSFGSTAMSAEADCGSTAGPASGKCFAISRAATAVSTPFYCSIPAAGAASMFPTKAPASNTPAARQASRSTIAPRDGAAAEPRFRASPKP